MSAVAQSMPPRRLDVIEALASELGFEARRVDSDRLDVLLDTGVILVFCNLEDEGDPLVGFEGTQWHAHGVVCLEVGEGEYVEIADVDILRALALGELVVVSQYVHDGLSDRWLAHVDGPLDAGNLGAGEVIRVTSVRRQAGDAAR
jgi:hypothetical protein